MRKPLFFLLIGLLFSLNTHAQSRDWRLIWNDEFNGTTLDQNNWNFETGTGVNGDFGTGQLDRATDRPENVAIEQNIPGADGGALRITTRKEAFMDRQYTSGRINTEGKVAYGPNHRIVARVWPKGVRTMGQGFAFWMMPNEKPAGQSTISWPQGGEVDIMEYVGSIPNHNLGSVHYAWAYNGNEWANWNHHHQGGYYSFADQQVADNPEWLRVDLGQLYNINRVVVNWENTGKTFEIQTSTDGTSWTTAYATANGDGGIDDLSFSARNARFVRMHGTQRSNDWGYSIYEMQVYAQGGSTNLALNKPATASSSQAADLAPANAVDGSATTRWSSGTRNPQYQCCAQSSPTDPTNGANGWHTYGINWFGDRMEFFVDDNVYHIHYFNDGGAGLGADGDTEEEVQIINGKRVKVSEYSNHFPEWRPFEHKMYMILSAGVGGGGQTYGGPIVDEAQFPADVYIDWVRVYSNGETFNPPPSVTLTAPTGAETYPAPANVTLNATASDLEGGTITSVAFYNGNTLLGTDNTAPYSFNWTNVAAGTYQVSARVTDNGGATATSNVVTVTVNDASSNLALNRPGTASSVMGEAWASNAFDASLTTRWESLHADPQWVYVDLGNTYDISRVKINWETAFARNYEVQVSSNAVNWTTIRSVTNNTTTVNDLTGLSGTGRYVRIYGTVRNTTYGYSILGVEVYGSGNANNVAPTVTLTGPANNAAFTAPASISIAANASDSDGSLTQVAFYNGNALLGTDTSSPYTFNWTNVAAGTYTLSARATDNGGAVTTSAAVNVTVSPAGSVNLALNKPATASSVVGGNSAAMAVDASLNTRWESNFSDPQWMYVDLGQRYAINQVRLRWETASGKAYQIQVSDNATTWTTIYSTTTGDGSEDNLTGLAGTGRYVRMYGTQRNTGWGYSLWELEVYGTPATSANIALNKPATASTTQSGLPVSNVNDGNMDTRWSSEWSDPQWVQIDLQAVYNISRVKLLWEAAAGKAYQIQVSNDGTNWTTVFTEANGNGATDELKLSGSGRYIRLYGTQRTTGYGYSLYEFEVYGSLSASAARTAGAEETMQTPEEAISEKVRLYPMPVNKQLNIALPDSAYEALELVDLSGKRVLHLDIRTLREVQIDMGAYQKGLYLIQLKGKHGTKTHKIIKQ